jgi:GNAT superfamily N-acetyltransferase
MKIRKIKKSDYWRVSEIMIKNIEDKISQFYPQDILDDFKVNAWIKVLEKRFQDRECFVLEFNNNIVWNICIKNNEIKSFYVDYNFQWKWFWRKLFNYAENILFNRNITEIYVHSLVWSKWFYEKLWFKCLKKVDLLTDINNLEYEVYHMKKILK